MEEKDKIEVLKGEVVSESKEIQKKGDSGDKLTKLVNSLAILAGFVYKFVSTIKKDHSDDQDNQRDQMGSSIKKGRRKRRGRR